jgi:hypothetical protein
VSESPDHLDAKFDEANLRLHDGLMSCRSLVKNYRAMILGARTAANDMGTSADHDRMPLILNREI